MTISTISNGESGSSVRTKLNLVIAEINGLGTAADADAGDFATAAQGERADTALQPADVDDNSTADDKLWSAQKLNSVLGDIETALVVINGEAP